MTTRRRTKAPDPPDKLLGGQAVAEFDWTEEQPEPPEPESVCDVDVDGGSYHQPQDTGFGDVGRSQPRH